MPGLSIKSILGIVDVQVRTIDCPMTPAVVLGLTSANAEDSGDQVGSLLFIPTPPSGTIHGARWIDPTASQSSQILAHLFKGSVTVAADDAAYSISDEDMRAYALDTIDFSTYYSNAASVYVPKNNLGIPYNTRTGGLWIALSTGGTPTYTTPGWPSIQLTIYSDDPKWYPGKLYGDKLYPEYGG